MNDADKTQEQPVEELTALRQQIKALRADEHRHQVISRVRDQIWQIRRGADEDMERLLEAVGSCLRELGVSFDQCGVNLLDREADPPSMKFYNITRNGQTIREGAAQAVGVILEIMRHPAVAYRKDLHTEDPYQERAYIEGIFKHPVRSVVDVPFSQGTLALNARQPDAFSPQDLEILQEMAQVLSEGFTRMEDLRVLEQRNRELEAEIARRRQMEERLCEAQRRHESRSAVRLRIASMDRPEDLFSVVQEIHAQLKALGVACDSATLQIVNPEGTDFVSVGESEYPHWDKLISDTWGERTPHTERYPWVLQVWKTNTPLYQPCLPAECGLLAGCSLIDVPFSHGTLAINCRRPHAFTARATELLQHFAGVLSEEFPCFQGLVEHWRMEKELQASEEMFHTLAETARAGIVIIQGTRLRYANQAVETISGYAREEFLSTNFWDKVHPEFRELIRERGLARLRGESVPPRYEFKILTKGGEERWIDASVATCPFDGERALVCVGIDMTERKRAEERLHVYQRELRSLAAQLALAEERTRRQLAQDLHDRVGQSLTLAKMKLDAMDATGDRFDEVRSLLRQVSADIRTLTFELSPPVLYELGLEAGLQWLAEQLQTQHGLAVEVVGPGRRLRLAEDVRTLLFRSVRELLLNVVKHAQVQTAGVTLEIADDQLHIEVVDAGVGFDPGERLRIHADGGFGLFSIRERMDYIGGRFDLETHPGRGTRCRLVLPLPSAPPAEEA